MRHNPALPGSRIAALYARVSTLDQGERYSLPSQLKAMRAKAAADGCEVREEYIFVDKQTGKDLDRPAFDRMRKLVKAGVFQAVIMFSIDRFSRKVMHAAALRYEFQKGGVNLDFVENKIDDTPQGNFVFNQYASFAQFMGELIIQNSNRGRREKAEEGFLNSGSVPYGYRYLGKIAGSRGQMIVCEEEAEVVRMVFRCYRTGMTLDAIARELNLQGVPTRSKKQPPRVSTSGKRRPPSGRWTRNVIWQMLRQEAYIGRFWWHRGKPDAVLIPVTAIIDPQTFEAAAAQIQRNRAQKVGRPSRQYLLRGLIWCRRCKHRCATLPNTGYPLYRCNHQERAPYRRLCEASGVSQKIIEAAVWDALWDELEAPGRLHNLVRQHYRQIAQTGSTASLNETAKKIAKLKRDSDAAFENMNDGDLAPERRAAAKRLHLQAEAERKRLEAETRTPQLAVLPSLDTVTRMCAEFQGGRTGLESYEDRRGFLERAVDRILYADREMEIHCRFALPAAAGASNGQKNCLSTVDRYDNSLASISFVIKRRLVA